MFDSVTVDSETTTAAFAVGHTIAESASGSFEAYVGVRAWWLDNSFDLRAVGGGRVQRDESDSWVSPLIGVAGRTQVADKWTLFGQAEVDHQIDGRPVIPDPEVSLGKPESLAGGPRIRRVAP